MQCDLQRDYPFVGKKTFLCETTLTDKQQQKETTIIRLTLFQQSKSVKENALKTSYLKASIPFTCVTRIKGP